jgi:hypothetical protein
MSIDIATKDSFPFVFDCTSICEISETHSYKLLNLY